MLLKVCCQPPIKPTRRRRRNKDVTPDECCEMFSNKFGGLMFGFRGLKATSVCGAIQRAASRSGFSWAVVCKQRELWQQRSVGTGMQRTGIRSASHTTVDPGEVKRFQLLANKWWDEEGDFAALHAMNDLRVPFVRDNLLNVQRERHPGKPLAGLKILDVGCGGGLLTEPLGRLGASVLGIDPVEDSIRTAQLHSSHDPDLCNRVSYRACTLEELSGEGEAEQEEQTETQFDAIVASEVVEHLADLETFAISCSHVLKPGGSLFITTINKTNLSYALAIVVAEQLLHIVPRGTHDWEKFVSPVELERFLESNGFLVQSVQGMLYNPISGAWSWANSTAINYALHAVKQDDETMDSSTPPGDHHEATHS
ncbi:ubiquinone biosynthesis O-methyltransferase, mitochondrial isoform X3 [Girardinichthys multiradiatus]|uniref:ubiquinone biosynthesis O-methyltransferase, mitochondrial isoform X3 n=1 Tax=Girardinichthys multiradiatus TaxID=208333 RepID=UPI001FAE3BA0|nr:ubiquinone biosynthesis O-methyltransferase, mitochondrial isoform X3 [Girardinichthys multiradiatus]